jgi:phage shock protein PspC (stress-responsive transcriptional regulator)
MTDQWSHGTGSPDTPAQDGRPRNERWIRRPRRSTGDRKIAGVAGGLGRAFGIDPVLIRVAFVVLTIFGGFGGLLYVLGWLLLPSDGDEVSAAEALLGRGSSSVSPTLAVGLGVVAVVAAFSMFSWGLPFLPLAIGGVIVLAVMRKRGRLGHHDWKQPHRWQGDWSNPGQDRRQEWMQRTDDQVRYVTDQAQQWADRARYAGQQARTAGRAARWGAGWATRPGGGWGGRCATSGSSSPFEEPAFWDRPAASSRVDPPAPRPAGGVDLTKTGPGPTLAEEELRDEPTPRTTPPAWDPLGVAPFAWDLPEPTPLPLPSAPSARLVAGPATRVAVGMTLLAGGLTAAGVFAGWWVLTWAQVSGIALGVLAIGLLISALRGRGHSLVGPGVFLSLVTLALAVTGISGTSGFGASTVTPTQLADLQPVYSFNAGELRLDLTGLTIPADQVRAVTVTVKGGHAEVIVPTGMTVAANCEARAGNVDCLGQTDRGVNAHATGTQADTNPRSGTLNVTVQVTAGFAQVTDHA